MDYMIRRARTPDVRAIAGLVDINVGSRRLLGKATVTLYEDVQEFWVAERAVDAAVVGCGALHVMWEDLAEIRTVAVRPGLQGHGIGHRLVAALLGSAREVGVRRVFVLTFATGFFARHGFVEITGTEATLAMPDPNGFGGEVRIRPAGSAEWTVIPAAGVTDGRGIGALDMARALRAGVPHRASGELALHVLDTLEAVTRSMAGDTFEPVRTTFPVPGVLPADWDPHARTL